MKYFLFILLFSFSVFAQIPTLTSPVMDNAKVLNNSSDLESQIREIYKSGEGPQINILTIDSLNGKSIEEYANQVFTLWKLGNAKRDDGVLFVIAIKDRKSRIEVGQGLEGSLTDAQSKRILSSLINDFKNKNYSNGIQFGLTQIIDAVSKKDSVQIPANSLSQISKESSDLMIALALGFLCFILGGRVWKTISSNKEKTQDLIKEHEKVLLNIKAAQTKISEIESTQKKSFPEVQENFFRLIKDKEKELEQLKAQNKKLQEKANQSPKTQLDQKNESLKEIQSFIAKEEQDIIHYSGILKGEG